MSDDADLARRLSEVKASLYQSLGCGFDDRREAAMRAHATASGKLDGAKGVDAVLSATLKEVDAALDAESVDIQTAQYAKKVLTSFAIKLRDYQASLLPEVMQAQGRYSAMVDVVKYINDLHVSAQRAVSSIVDYATDDAAQPTLGGKSVKPSLKKRRQQEAEAGAENT